MLLEILDRLMYNRPLIPLNIAIFSANKPKSSSVWNFFSNFHLITISWPKSYNSFFCFGWVNHRHMPWITYKVPKILVVSETSNNMEVKMGCNEMVSSSYERIKGYMARLKKKVYVSSKHILCFETNCINKL